MYSKNRKLPEGVPDIKLPARRERVDIFCDFETYLFIDGFPLWEFTDEEKFSTIIAEKAEVVPWLLGVYAPEIVEKNGKQQVDHSHYSSWWSAEFPHDKLFEYLKRVYELGYLPVLWFHNTSYDLTAAIETCFRRLDPNLKVYFRCKENKNFLSGAMESDLWNFQAKFGDTLLYKSISIAAIGEMFNSPKGEIPYCMADLYIQEGVVHFKNWTSGEDETIELDKCVDYVIQDVFLLFKYHRQLIEETELITIAINQAKTNKVRTTTQGVHARSLLDLWMHKMINQKFDNFFKFPVSREMGIIMQKSLTGGYTTLNSECFNFVCPEGWLITSYDCNSMYPFIMTQGLPYGDLLDAKPEGKSIEWVLVACAGVEWTGHMGILKTPPISDINQTKDWDKPRRFFIMREMLEYIKQRASGKFKEFGVYYQKTTLIAGEFAIYLYKLRKQIQDRQEELKHLLENEKIKEDRLELAAQIKTLDMQQKGVKTTMNSLYGKMAEKSYIDQVFYHSGKFNSYIEDLPVYKCVLSGAYIALTGRFMVYKKIEGVINKGFQFLYSDTDSVKFAYPKHKEVEIEEIFGINTGKLGEWKNEGVWDEFHTPGKKKKYLLINKAEPTKTVIKLSGISDDPYVFAFENGLHIEPEKTIENLKYIFSSQHNVLFINAKNTATRTLRNEQLVIYGQHVSSNSALKYNTAKCYVLNGLCVLEVYE